MKISVSLALYNGYDRVSSIDVELPIGEGTCECAEEEIHAIQALVPVLYARLMSDCKKQVEKDLAEAKKNEAKEEVPF
jgi:hypothetical protein